MLLRHQGALTVCRISNNYKGEIKKKGDRFVSSKEDSDMHGIGIRNVERIVNNYSGYIQQDYDDGVYVVTVILPVPV